MLTMMRTFKFISLFLISFTLIFSSCKKEELPRPNNDNTVVEDDATVEGVLWVLSEGRVYVENMDNGETYVYDYFGGGTTEAQIHIFSSSIVEMDSIKQNYTSWYFQNGMFTLNGGSSWEYTEYNGVYTPIGLSGGTSRPIQVTHVSDESMTVVVHEAYESDGVNNFRYFSELTFVVAGGSCNSCQPDVAYGWIYGGVWNPANATQTTLEDTKWVVTRYNNGLSGNVYPNDTLHFISQNKYTINGGPQRSYTMSGVVGNNMKSLNMYSFTTLGGDYSGQVQGTFIDDWVINNSEFSDMFDVNNTVTVWMERIQ
jgi:hypothetical protein